MSAVGSGGDPALLGWAGDVLLGGSGNSFSILASDRGGEGEHHVPDGEHSG